MYSNPKGNNVRKIIFLIIANIILIFVVLLLFSWVLKWDLTKFFNWIPIVNQPTEEGITEREVDPLVIEKSDMDKRDEYLNAKEQQLDLMEKELESIKAELKAYESELRTQKETLDKERRQFDRQKEAYYDEEARLNTAAKNLNNMEIAAAVTILSSEEINLYDVARILLKLDKIAEELGRSSITPAILQEMAYPSAEVSGNLDENEIQRRQNRAAQITDWFARYEIEETQAR